MREEYLKEFHAKHDAAPGKEPLAEAFTYRGVSWDELKPHLWKFFQGAKNHRQVTEDAVLDTTPRWPATWPTILLPQERRHLGRRLGQIKS